MPNHPPSVSFSPTFAFKHLGGDPSVDFVNTAHWITQGPRADHLTNFGRVVEWAEGCGVVSSTSADRLRTGARARREEAEAALEKALTLRWVLRRVFLSVGDGPIHPTALGEFNDILSESVRHLYLGTRPDEPSVRLLWRGMGAPLDSVLWPVAWAASNLLVSGAASAIRQCGAEDCGLIYVDRSRNHLRRWCEMETCGTRAKSRRRAERSRA